MVNLSTTANPLYSTSALRQIRYTSHLPSYKHVVLQLLDGLVATSPGPLAFLAAAIAPPPSLLEPQRSAPKIVLT